MTEIRTQVQLQNEIYEILLYRNQVLQSLNRIDPYLTDIMRLYNDETGVIMDYQKNGNDTKSFETLDQKRQPFKTQRLQLVNHIKEEFDIINKIKTHSCCARISELLNELTLKLDDMDSDPSNISIVTQTIMNLIKLLNYLTGR